MQEVDNILRILKEAKQALNENNSYQLKTLSDQTVHSATIAQDADNVLIAVLVYSLSKIIERDKIRKAPGWKDFYTSLIKDIDELIAVLNKNNVIKAEQIIKRINNSIEKIAGNLKNYVHDVLIKAKINKASKIYEHGLSLQQTADLLGVSIWDLSQYVGQSYVSEVKLNESIPVEKRIKIAEDIFS